MRKALRNTIVASIAVVCTAITAHLFDWRDILVALQGTRVDVLVVGSMVTLSGIFFLRGLRWLVVLDITPTRAALLRSTLANGAASGLASLTPFQLGEALKIKFIPQDQPERWKSGVSGFFFERTLDLTGLLGIGLCGLAIHLGHAWTTPFLLSAPIACALVLTAMSNHIDRLPARIRPYLTAFVGRRRMLIASIITIPLWLLNAVLWWCAATSVNVLLGFSDVSILLGGVTLAIAASMTPGGIGVSELGTRSIMLWLGFSVAEAEATAIGLRLLSPFIVSFGALCLVCLIALRKLDQTDTSQGRSE